MGFAAEAPSAPSFPFYFSLLHLNITHQHGAAFHADALGLHIAFHMGGGAEGAPLFLRILCRAHPFYEPAAHSPPVQNRSGRLGIGQSALGIFLCPLIFHGQYTSNIDVHCKPLLEKNVCLPKFFFFWNYCFAPIVFNRLCSACFIIIYGTKKGTGGAGSSLCSCFLTVVRTGWAWSGSPAAQR